MTHPWYHAVRSAELFGGVAEDYIEIHNWFDESKAFLPDFRHRALRHHAEGIFLCERIFGATIENSLGQVIPIRTIGEQHIQEDLGWIPTVKDWLRHIKIEPWMGKSLYQPMRDARLKKLQEE
ncbi:MAG: hypothetical protein AAFV72_24005 [Cyanobacteria bacterium J06635_1]